MSIKFSSQYDQMDCGPACLKMIASYYGKDYSLQYLRENCFLTKDGVSLAGIREASEKIGFEMVSAKLTLQKLIENYQYPCIIHWHNVHFVVLYKIKKRRFGKGYLFKLADPAHGFVTVSEEEFKKNWENNETDKGIALFLTPTERFEQLEEHKETIEGIRYLWKYLKPYKKELLQLLTGLFAGSLFTLIFPFLTQLLIDKGVGAKSMSIVFIILLGQLFLFLGSSFIEVIRNWIMLYIGARINIHIIADFLHKLIKLPIHFFDTKMIGDFTQRIGDHQRIEQFLTSQSLFASFSLLNLCVFCVVLAWYDVKILGVYILLTTLAIGWIFLFLRRRKILDYSKFHVGAENHEITYELLNGMQEMKLNRFENYKIDVWEKVQIKLFQINTKILALDQYQIIGYNFINQFKNIMVTFLAAREVILGNLTLGAMLSVSYIIGQMNSPLNQLISFFRSLQDARISLERLGEIHQREDEEQENQLLFPDASKSQGNANSGIQLSRVSFQYEGPQSPYVLRDIDLFIPQGKITAIVGASGSGKTTLMKLLLKFYAPIKGHIWVNEYMLEKISAQSWRDECGVVMQDGFIFSDTIERNIATSDEIDKDRLRYALEMANLQDFVNRLPLGLKTKVGASGNGISGGQKQRILIARAIYKDPRYLFFDEATSALDADNESVIMENLTTFMEGRTSVVIAHRLSTVKNADQIIVLKNGEIVEVGNHYSLVKEAGDYFHLVKNQLELGG